MSDETSDDTYLDDEEDNDLRRIEDAQVREVSRQYDMPIRDAVTGEPVQIHVVSWVNNTFWRVAVGLAFLASLFSIYDNGQRVDRLEGQVCESLSASMTNINTLQYYKDHPLEAEEQRARLLEDLSRFHCPDPGSPTVEGLGMPDVVTGIVEFGRKVAP
jgi:hypothetical protein